MADRINREGRNKPRVTEKVRVAITGIVFEALTRSEACKKAKITPHGLYVAMRKPHVMAFYRSCMEVLRAGAGGAAVAKIEKLMHTAVSEHVQLASAQWMAGIEGIGPVAKAEIQHRHSHLVAGLVVVRASQPEPAPVLALDGHTIEPQPRQRPRVNMIGRGVPHPSLAKHPPGPIQLDTEKFMEGLRKSPAWAAMQEKEPPK
jgi:hypothetical protein